MNTKARLVGLISLVAELVGLLSACSSLAVTTFERKYGGSEWGDIGYSVLQTSDGGYVVAGETWCFGAGMTDAYLIKTDSLGDTLWTATYGHGEHDMGCCVEQTSDGGYVISGFTYSFGEGGDVYLVKTDSAGNLCWEKNYGGPRTDFSYSVTQTSDGGYFLAGYRYAFDPHGEDVDIYVVKTDSSGNPCWERAYGGDGQELGYSGIQTPDGGYVVVGQTSSFGSGRNDIYLVKTDSAGNVIWERTYGGTADDIGYCVAQTCDGGYVVSGEAGAGTGTGDAYLVKTDCEGEITWEGTYGGSSIEKGYSVCQAKDGGYVVVGRTYSFGSGKYDVYLIKTDPSGKLLWTRTYGGAGFDYARAVRQTSDGGYILAGYTDSVRHGDIYLIKTDEKGRVRKCQPVEPPEVRSQGYWRRQCKQNPHEDVCAYVDSIHVLANLFAAFNCDSICDLMNVDPPENDMCKKAERQYMALLLNVASGKLALCNCLQDGSEIEDIVAEINSLLSRSPSQATCEYANSIADDLNNGIGIVRCGPPVAPRPPDTILHGWLTAGPSPSACGTVIRYELAVRQRVNLGVYDVAGRLVQKIINSIQETGLHVVEWDGADFAGQRVATGTYFIRLESDNTFLSRRIVLLR